MSDFKVSIPKDSIELNDNSLTFDFKGDPKYGLDKTIVNGIRRTLLSSMPGVAFRTIQDSDLTVVTNNSSLHNEFLLHRIGLIPLYINPYEWHKNLLFQLKVDNKTNQLKPISAENFDIYKVKASILKKCQDSDDYSQMDNFNLENYNISELPKWKRNFLIKNWKLYNDNKDHIDAWLAKYNNLEHLKQTHTKFEWQANDAERDLWKLIFHFRPSGMRVKKPDYFPALVAITQTSVVGKIKRRITPREAARLQSFPDTFEIHPIDKIAYKQFGNAVNVDVVKYLCVKLMELSSYDLEVTNSIPQTELFKQ